MTAPNKITLSSSTELIKDEVITALSNLSCFWLTRDRIGGDLGEIDVWAVEPVRERFEDGDVIWHAPDDEYDTFATCVDSWTEDEAHKRIGCGYPNTDRECVRVGEPATKPNELS